MNIRNLGSKQSLGLNLRQHVRRISAHKHDIYLYGKLSTFVSTVSVVTVRKNTK